MAEMILFSLCNSFQTLKNYETGPRFHQTITLTTFYHEFHIQDLIKTYILSTFSQNLLARKGVWGVNLIICVNCENYERRMDQFFLSFLV